MALKRKRASSAKPYSKRRRAFKRPVRRTNLGKLVRRVALNTSETKHAHRSVENVNLNHNAPLITNNVLYTTNGEFDETIDNTTSYATRLGDEIYLKGIDFRFWLSNKPDRPNVQYRIVIYKYKTSSSLPDTSAIFQDYALAVGVYNNKMIAYADTQNITVLKQFRVQSNGGDYSLESGSTIREKSFERSVFLPMKMAKIKYSNLSGGTPKFWDIGVAIVAYDAYGTLISDNIASVAWSYKLYFKDP